MRSKSVVLAVVCALSLGVASRDVAAQNRRGQAGARHGTIQPNSEEPEVGSDAAAVGASILSAIRIAAGQSDRPDGVTVHAPCGQFESTILGCGSNVPNGFLGGTDCVSSEGYIIELYRLSVSAGVPVTVRVTSSSSNNILVAIQDNSGIVASQYAVGSVAVSYTPPATGTYYVGIGFVAKFATGSYGLTVTCNTAPEPGTCPPVVINCGAQVIGSLSTNDCTSFGGSYYTDSYRVAVQKGQNIEISFTGDFPGYLDVWEAKTDGEAGVYSGNKRSLTSVITSTEAGYVDFTVSSWEEKATGGYLMTVKCAAAPSCKQRAVRH